ncbi:MAG: hypothetical protein MZV70_05225 [Desulfobacterales bacterium]|nr:hypothetical protein [Desulfobacterales bacterium]
MEELPRILAILGPAHHLVGAQALDQLFGVEPPPPAVNMRRALLETLFFSEHLQKIYFLLTAWEHPFRELRQAGRGAAVSPVPGALPDEIMHALALAQEGAAILGGRSAHPLTAIAGGVSRYLKEDAYLRLADIAEQCLPGRTPGGRRAAHGAPIRRPAAGRMARDRRAAGACGAGAAVRRRHGRCRGRPQCRRRDPGPVCGRRDRFKNFGPSGALDPPAVRLPAGRRLARVELRAAAGALLRGAAGAPQ